MSCTARSRVTSSPGGKEEMDVVGHQDELVKLESPLLAIILKGGEK
jgi:hypothetical protein